MSPLRIRLSIFINYMLFGILLNSVGTVILQSQRFFGVSESQASILEAFKDLPIAIVSFFIAAYIVRIGYRKAMLAVMVAVGIACFLVPHMGSFWYIKTLFAIIGASFACVKISVFGIVGLISPTEKEHLSLMSFLESMFMVGVLSGYFLFGFFVDDADPGSDRWLKVYYVLGSMSFLAVLLLWSTRVDEREAHKKNEQETFKIDAMKEMFGLLAIPTVISFVICAFLYVLIEQSIMSWLPTYNNKVLQIPSTFSIYLAGILSASIGIGRFLAGIVLKKYGWYGILTGCLVCCAALVLIALPLGKMEGGALDIRSFWDIPPAAAVFPLIGFFLAPIYPAINSVILSSLPKYQHSNMSGLIVVFSALGGSLGSVITGNIFQRFGGQHAFYFSLFPMLLLAIALFTLKKMKDKLSK